MKIILASSWCMGIDIGTGSTKAVAINQQGAELGNFQVFYTSQSPHLGYSEQNPEIIWKAFVKCVKEVVEQVGSPPMLISLSCAMHGLLLIDDKNDPITNLITWADIRSSATAAALRKSKLAQSLYKETGTPIHSMSPLCKIAWFRRHSKKEFLKAHKFISIKELIWHRIFNEYQIDESVASATGLLNIISRKWNKSSLKIAGITEQKLSEIVPTHFIRRDISSKKAALFHLPAGTPFCIGASDGCLANVGSDATRSTSVALTIGTSGAVRIARAQPIFDFGAMLFNYILDKKTFISGGPVNNGGNALKWMFSTFLNISDPTDTDYQNYFKKIATIEPGCEGLIFLPYLLGERAPIWDEKASGAFYGIRFHHTQSHFLRSVIEGICFGLYDILSLIEKDSKRISQIMVSGGFTHSRVWLQILSDITGKKLALIKNFDSSAVGAAYFGMKSLKVVSNYQPFFDSKSTIIYPDLKKHVALKKQFLIFKKLTSFQQSNKIFREL